MDYKDENMWLMLGDCLERMKEIPDGSVVLKVRLHEGGYAEDCGRKRENS